MWVAISGIWVAFSIGAPDFFAPQRVGTIPPSGTNQVSGMVRAAGRPDCFWIHNDGSDPAPRIWAIHQSGRLIAELAITGAANGDWEDIAVGECGDPPVRCLFIADAGTNLAPRAVVSIWRVEEPDLAAVAPGAKLVSEPAEELRVRYPGGTIRDAEGLVVDPLDGALYLFSREASLTRVFRVPAAPDADGIRTLVNAGTLQVTGQATGADLSPGGGSLLVRSYTGLFLLERAPGAPFAAFLTAPLKVLPAPQEIQGESITWDPSGLDYLTTSEGASAPIYRMWRKFPQASCTAEADASRLRFVRGDLVAVAGSAPDVAVDITDAVALMDVLGASPAPCMDAGDVDDDGDVDRGDLNRLLGAMAAGRSIPLPFPAAAPDPSPDPRACFEGEMEELVSEGDEWAYWYSAEPPPEGWRGVAGPPPNWPRGPGGVGFGRAGLGTVIPADPALSPALYGRLEFTAAPIGSSQVLALEADCAHGFIAYLNGVEVARGGLPDPGFAVPREMPAPLHLGGKFERIAICKDLLAPEGNVLAIEAHNTFSANSRLCFRVRVRRYEVVPRPDPVALPPLEGSPRISIETGAPLHPGAKGAMTVVLESAEEVRGASWVLEHDGSIRITGGSTGGSLAPGAVTALGIDPVNRRVAQAFVAGPPGETLPPGRREVAGLSFEVLAAQPGAVRLSFIRRAGVGSVPGLENRVTGKDRRTSPLESEPVEWAISWASFFLRGDIDAAGAIDISDGIGILNWLFLDAAAPACVAAADANADGVVDLGDALFLFYYLFVGGDPPAPPFPSCGPGSAPDEILGCATEPSCN